MSISSSGNRVPDYQREMAELRAEIKKLWLALGKDKPLPPVQKNMPFSWSGAVTGTKLSGPWVAETDLFITGAALSQAVAPSGTTSAALRVNGVTMHTFNLYSHQGRSVTTTRIAVNVGDRVQLYVTGGGGSDQVASLNYVTNEGW